MNEKKNFLNENNDDPDSKFICTNEERCAGLSYCGGCICDGSHCSYAKAKEEN